MLLLDEPTTGLDAFTARHVVETLQQIAHNTFDDNNNTSPISAVESVVPEGFKAKLSKQASSNRRLASTQRTVIMSIHQPRYDVFALVDDVVLLSRGKQIWAGCAEKMLLHFEQIGQCVMLKIDVN